MRFVVKTYFLDDKKKKSYNVNYFFEYVFNVLYRSIIPISIVYGLCNFEIPIFFTIFFILVLIFLVFYQFSWVID